jgi:tetratricopeptide (TPR) repeat protein
MRKRILVGLSIMTVAGVLFAQQPVDYLLKARANMDYGQFKEAIILLSDGLVKNNFKDYRFFILRAEGYLANGDYTNAAEDYQSANSLLLASGDYGIARIYAMKGDPINSLKHLEENMGSSFKKSEKEVLLDKAFSFIENTPEWRLFWKKERYGILERKISEIEYYLSLRKQGDAEDILAQLSADYSHDPELLYAKALADLASGKSAECISVITKILESDQKNEKYIRLLAKAQFISGNPAGASESYSKLINSGIVDAGLFISRAECFYKTGETEKALKDVSEFLELYPDNKNAISFAGRLEAQSGDNLMAIDYFSKNLKFHPDDPECYIDRANSYFVSRTWDYAVRDYSMALDIQPSNSESWLNKGMALLNLGKTEDACHDFNLALSLGNKKASGYISRHCIK